MTTLLDQPTNKPAQYLVIKGFLEHRKLTIVEGTTYWTEYNHVLIVQNKRNIPIIYCNKKDATFGFEWYPYTLEGVDAAMEDIRKLAGHNFHALYEEHYKNTTEAMQILSSLFNESGTELLPQESTSPTFWEFVSLS